MAQFELKDVVVTPGGEKQAPKLALKVGSRTITLATFKTGEDADAFEEILVAAQKQIWVGQ